MYFHIDGNRIDTLSVDQLGALLQGIVSQLAEKATQISLQGYPEKANMLDDAATVIGKQALLIRNARYKATA